MTEVIDHLMKLGLSEYEAKAYVATVALGEGTIKEISEESKVPRSRAYDVMERLLERGFVEAGNSVPRCYRANDPAKALDHMMDEIKRSRDAVVRVLEEIGDRAERRDNPLWTIKGEWAIDHKVLEMLESSRKEIGMICLNNSYLIRYGKTIKQCSRTRSITIVLKEGTNEFADLLGNARVLQMSNRMVEPPEPMIKETLLQASENEFDVELVMVCDHGDSLILSKEGSGHRAIISSGTVLDFFVNRMMKVAIDEAQEDRVISSSRKKRSVGRSSAV